MSLPEKKLLASLLVSAVLCLALAIIVTHVTSGSPSALSDTTVSMSRGKVLNAKILIVTTSASQNMVSASVASILRQHFSNVQVLNYNVISSMGGSKNGLPDALILIPSNNGLIPEDVEVLSIIKKILRSGKLLVVTDVKPLNTLMLMRFLQKLGLDKVTLDNIRSAIYEKEITVSNGVTRTSAGEDIYVFALSLDNGEYPAMYILSADIGAKVAPAYVYNYVATTISNFLKDAQSGGSGNGY